jgi:O-antigen/teichoic acid export membrane protein
MDDKSLPVAAEEIAAFERGEETNPSVGTPGIRRRGAKSYLASGVWSQICALLRYVLLARLLGPEQLGLAATLILTASFFDLVSDIGGDRFLIQDANGDSPRIQAMVQLALVGRGVAIAIGMGLCAWPVAAFYNAPSLGPALVIFGLAPLIMGFMHLDLRRIQRESDFRSESLCLFFADTTSLVCSVLAAWLTHSFTSVLYGFILRNLIWVICSHVIAARPYQLGYCRQDAGRLARFSAPLMLNGLILFLGGQGDRVLVSRRVGIAALGHYSAVILLIFYPAAVIQKYAHAIYLPLIASERSHPSRGRSADVLASQTLLLALGMSIGFALVAPFAVSLLYGRAFALPVSTVALIGFLQASRFLSVWPTTVALAQGRSIILLTNNVVRLVAWPAAWTWGYIDGSLAAIVAGFLLGELIAFAVAVLMLNRSQGVALFRGFGRFAGFIGTNIVVLGWTQPGLPLWVILILSALTAVVGGIIVRSEFTTIRGSFLMGQRILLRRR